MASSFGADTDYWGIVDTNWELQSSGETPGTSAAQCMDSFGDIAAETVYDTVTEYNSVYKCCKNFAVQAYDTANGIDMRLGLVVSSKVLTSADIVSSNTEYLMMTLSGRTCPSADSAVRKYNWLDTEDVGMLTLCRKALPIGCTKDSVTRVTGGSLNATVNVAVCQDSVGTTVALQTAGGVVTGATDLCGATGDPNATVDTATGWTKRDGPGKNAENTSYKTGAFNVFKNLVGSDT